MKYLILLILSLVGIDVFAMYTDKDALYPEFKDLDIQRKPEDLNLDAIKSFIEQEDASAEIYSEKAENAKNSESKIHLAAAYFPSHIKQLLAQGADIESKDDDGCTPLHYAVHNKNLESIKILIEAGADINACDNKNNNVISYILTFCPDLMYTILDIVGNDSKAKNPAPKIETKVFDFNLQKEVTEAKAKQDIEINQDSNNQVVQARYPYLQNLILAGLLGYSAAAYTYVLNKSFRKTVNDSVSKINQKVKETPKKTASYLSSALAYGYSYFKRK